MQSTLKPGELIRSSSSVYQVQKRLGSGMYGEVSVCRNLTSNQMVALKVITGLYWKECGRQETKVLKTIKDQGSENSHIVRWLGSFESPGRSYLEFEKLDINLTQFQCKRPYRSLRLMEIRPIICQMAGALMFLQRVGIMHCDLKPENIMMIDHVGQPLCIKIIDFGMAGLERKAKQGKERQTLWYRAPETLLGAPVTGAIDMWSVGCIAAQMFLGAPLFPAKDEKEMMKMIVETVGHPPKSCLDQGMFTSQFYHQSNDRQWEFKENQLNLTRRLIKQLEERDPRRALSTANALDDRVVFVNLLQRMLDPNPETRTSPEEVFQHPFIKMHHLQKSDYFAQSVRIMTKAWQSRKPQSYAPSAPASEAPPTTAASQGQTNMSHKRKHEEQESPCKKRRQDKDLDEHRSKEARKTPRDSSVSSPSKRTSSTSSRQGHHGLQGHLTNTTGSAVPAAPSALSSASRGKRKREEDVVHQTSLPAPKWKKTENQQGPQNLHVSQRHHVLQDSSVTAVHGSALVSSALSSGGRGKKKRDEDMVEQISLSLNQRRLETQNHQGHRDHRDHNHQGHHQVQQNHQDQRHQGHQNHRDHRTHQDWNHLGHSNHQSHLSHQSHKSHQGHQTQQTHQDHQRHQCHQGL